MSRVIPILCAIFTLASCSAPVPEGRSPSVPPVARFIVERSDGAHAARVRAAFAPAQRAADECRPSSGGMIRLRVTSDPTGVRVSVEPSSTLGPRERQCVLGALSTIDVTAVSDEAGRPSAPPGFTALVRVEW